MQPHFKPSSSLVYDRLAFYMPSPLTIDPSMLVCSPPLPSPSALPLSVWVSAQIEQSDKASATNETAELARIETQFSVWLNKQVSAWLGPSVGSDLRSRLVRLLVRFSLAHRSPLPRPSSHPYPFGPPGTVQGTQEGIEEEASPLHPQQHSP